MRFALRMCALLVALSVFAFPSISQASIIGLYYRGSDDTITVHMKDGRPFLKLEVEGFIDLPECQGFQTYRDDRPNGEPLELMDGDKGKGTGFMLWESKACLDAYYKASSPASDGAGLVRAVPRKKLVQEIDIYNEFFALFTNKDELVKGFEAGEFFLAVGYQANYDGYESKMLEILYTYQDAVDGKALFAPSTDK